MTTHVQVVANGQNFDVPESVHQRWPDDYPLATTATGKQTAASKRAREPKLPALAPATTKTADDLKADGSTDAGHSADDTQQEGAV